jgi:hypothetical protein
MITVVLFVVLAALSAHVRQLAHRVAMFVLDVIGLGCVFVAAALESQTRRRRLFGLVLFAVFMIGLWGATTVAMRFVLWLP